MDPPLPTILEASSESDSSTGAAPAQTNTQTTTQTTTPNLPPNQPTQQAASLVPVPTQAQIDAQNRAHYESHMNDMRRMVGRQREFRERDPLVLQVIKAFSILLLFCVMGAILWASIVFGPIVAVCSTVVGFIVNDEDRPRRPQTAMLSPEQLEESRGNAPYEGWHATRPAVALSSGALRATGPSGTTGSSQTTGAIQTTGSSGTTGAGAGAGPGDITRSGSGTWPASGATPAPKTHEGTEYIELANLPSQHSSDSSQDHEHNE